MSFRHPCSHFDTYLTQVGAVRSVSLLAQSEKRKVTAQPMYLISTQKVYKQEVLDVKIHGSRNCKELHEFENCCVIFPDHRIPCIFFFGTHQFCPSFILTNFCIFLVSSRSRSDCINARPQFARVRSVLSVIRSELRARPMRQSTVSKSLDLLSHRPELRVHGMCQDRCDVYRSVCR